MTALPQKSTDPLSPEQVRQLDYPKELKEMEDKAVQARCAAAATPATPMDQPPLALALSGGGIRSATFNLGVLQALAEPMLLRYFDYLSTVSGGGYIGGFLTRWFKRKEAGVRQEAMNDVERDLPRESAEVVWLRKHGNYIAPSGKGEYWINAGIYLRNFLAVQLVLGVFFLALFGAADLVRYGLKRWIGDGVSLPSVSDFPLSSLFVSIVPASWTQFTWSPWLMVLEVVVLTTVVPLAIGFWLSLGERKEESYNVAVLSFSAIIGGILLWWAQTRLTAGNPWSALKPLCGLLVLLAALLWTEWCWWVAPNANWQNERRGKVTRNLLSSYLGWWLEVVAWLSLFVLADTAGGLLANLVDRRTPVVDWLGPLAAVLTAMIPIVKWLADQITASDAKSSTAGRIGRQLLITFVYALTAAVPLVAISFVAHALYQRGSFEIGCAATVIALLLSFVLRFPSAIEFINRSSIQAAYGAWLARAYLGASNPERHADPTKYSVGTAAPEDDIYLRNCRPDQTLGPLQIINAMVNETIDYHAGRETRDRRGEILAVSCCGMSVGRRFHALCATHRIRNL